MDSSNNDTNNNNKENVDKTDKKEMNENENNDKYEELIEKLKCNKLGFILDKLDLKKIFDSIENKKKIMNEATSILNNEEMEIFTNIIDLKSLSILKPTSYKNEPIKPPKPREPASSLPLPSSPNNTLKRASITMKTNSLPPLISSLSNSLSPSETMYINHNMNNMNNNNINTAIGIQSIVTPNVQINVSNITRSNIPSAPQKQAILFKDMVNASLSPHKLIQNGLSAISEAYGKHINDIHNELKRHQRATTMAIQHIDDKLNMLCLHKKQLKINLANFTRDVNNKLDELQAHKTYINAVNNKYSKSLKNNNNYNDNYNNNKNEYLYSNLVCKQCGDSFMNESELNTHLEIHRNEIPKLSATEWKNTLLDLIDCYQPQIQQFEQQQNQKLKDLKIPMFPPNIIENNNNHNSINNKHINNNNISNKNNVNIIGGMRINNNINSNNGTINRHIINNNNNNINQPKYLGAQVVVNTNPITIPQFNINPTNMNNLQILGSIPSNPSSSKQMEVVDITETGSSQTSDNGSESSDDDDHDNNNNNDNDENESDYDSDSSSESEPIINEKKRKLKLLVPSSLINPKIKKRKKRKKRKEDYNYPSTLDFESVIKFRVNEFIDYRDFNARYLKAKIMQIEYDETAEINKFGIHYIDWDDKWNVWSIPKYQFRRYALYGTISQRGLHRESMNYVSLQRPWGHFIEVRPLHLHYHSMYKIQHQPNDSKVDRNYVNKYLEWHIGQICLSDKFSAQVQVVLFRKNEHNEWYKPQPKADLYWVHLDNQQECAPKNTHIINPLIKKTVKKKKSVKRSNNNNNIQPSGPPTKRQRQN